MYFETHAHFDDRRYDEDRDQIIEEAKKAGVDIIVNCGSSMRSSRASVELAGRYDYIYATVGVHPHDVKSMDEEKFESLKLLASAPKVIAIGEIGLDYFYEHSERELQKVWFAKQIEFAIEIGLPVIIHNRDAHEDTFDVLEKGCQDAIAVGKVLRGVIHCFSGSAEMASRFVKLGFFIAFGGAITFKNSRKSLEAIEVVPIERILIETDCPYLAPEPFRGKRNTSAYLNFVVDKIEEVKGMGHEDIAKQTYDNAKVLFGIG